MNGGAGMYNILEFLGVFSRKTLALRLENGQVLSNDAPAAWVQQHTVGSEKKTDLHFYNLWPKIFYLHSMDHITASRPEKLKTRKIK